MRPPVQRAAVVPPPLWMAVAHYFGLSAQER
jgi:hypothetical protein